MQTLGLCDEGFYTESLGLDDGKVPEEPRKFWRRQFQEEPTKRQRHFDWLFGVILPVVCVAADPIVFAGNFSGDGALLGQIKPFAYLLSFASIMAMTAYLLWGRKLGGACAAFSGLFLVGSVVSLSIGIVILPFSILGLILLIGILGFTPLFSAFVYFRNSIRVFRFAKLSLNRSVMWHLFAGSALFSFVVPYVVNVEINMIVNQISYGDVGTIRREAKKLTFIAPIVNLDPVKRRYEDTFRYKNSMDGEKGSVRTEEMANIYREITGKKITEY